MKKINLILASLTLFGLMTGCGGGNTSADAHGITMTLTPKGKVEISLSGSQTATIDWGDGSPVETVTLGATPWFEHQYAQKTEYTVQITGENITEFWCPNLNVTNLNLNVPTLTKLLCSSTNLTTLDLSKTPALISLECYNSLLKNINLSQNSALEDLNCYGNQLTSLDVSKNPALTSLECGDNQLTSLDVSKNSELRTLDCSVNQFSAEALNTLFRTLCINNNEDKTLYIGNNPGGGACDENIAEERGWNVRMYMDGDPPSREDDEEEEPFYG